LLLLGLLNILQKNKFMKQTFIALLFAATVSAGCNTKQDNDEKNAVGADTSTTKVVTDTATAATPDSATMMKNWMAYMMPGDVHKMMASWDGTWTGAVLMWQAPGAPPEKSTSTAINKTIMGGRYQLSNHTGSMMGQPFEGMSTLAYDNARKKFISTWIDNVGTGMMVLEGTWDEASKTMNLSGNVVDPSAGTGKQMPVRETFKVIDDNTQLMEMYGAGPDGKEFKMMEIKFTRK
jgi:predicted small secreted protein